MPRKVGAFVAALWAVWTAGHVPAARGAVIQVETTSDAGGIAVACRLRNAITAANTDAPSGACPAGSGADTIDLHGLGGTIALNGALPAISSDVTIRGPGADLLAVSGQDASRVFLIDGGAVVIRDVTIRDGFVAATGRGGAISVVEGSLVLSDCRITSSRAFNGAGVDGLDSTLRIDRCLIDGNETTGNSGAGVANIRGVLEINDSTIANNVAGLPEDVQTGTGGGVATLVRSARRPSRW